MFGLLILLVLIVVSGYDVLWRIIPNSLCLIIATLGVGWQITQGSAQLPFAVLQAIGLFAVLLPFCSGGILGGGDAKLLAALAVSLSFYEVLQTLLTTIVFGGLLGCAYLLLSRVPIAASEHPGRTRLYRALSAERERIRTRESIPYGFAIAAGWAGAVLPSRLEGAAWPFVW